MSVCSPAAICGHPFACGGVGSSGVKRAAFTSKEFGVKVSPRVTKAKYPPRGGGRVMPSKPYTVRNVTYQPVDGPGYVERGKASWYGQDFHGRRTANGEIFGAYYLTAASPVLQSGDAHISVASVFGLALRRRAYEVAPQSPIVTALELPQMSPGTYALCVQPRAGVFLGSAPPGPCDHGTLAAGGSLQLALRPESWPTSKN